jgi:hypothetical protein
VFYVMSSPATAADPTAGRLFRCERPEDFIRWDQFVDRHPRGLIYHTARWKKAIENAFPHIRGEIVGLVDSASGVILAGLPIYVARSWLLGNRTISVPFATLGEPLFQNKSELQRILRELPGFTPDRSARPIEFRGVSNASPLAELGFARGATYKHQYIELNEPPEKLLYKCSRTAVRQMISKAAKEGIRVTAETSPEALETFYTLFVHSRRRLRLPPMPLKFFKSLRENLDPGATVIFVARKGDVPYGAALGLKYKRDFFLEYSGELPDVQKTGVNQILYWTAIQDASAGGFSRFSFGRSSPQNIGLIEYKRRWGSTEEDIFTYMQAGSPAPGRLTEEASFSYSLIQKFSDIAPLPLFRLMGEFCFSHWA